MRVLLLVTILLALARDGDAREEPKRVFADRFATASHAFDECDQLAVERGEHGSGLVRFIAAPGDLTIDVEVEVADSIGREVRACVAKVAAKLVDGAKVTDGEVEGRRREDAEKGPVVLARWQELLRSGADARGKASAVLEKV